jgi:hypothetical protein
VFYSVYLSKAEFCANIALDFSYGGANSIKRRARQTRYKIDRSFLRGIKPTGDWQEFSDAELRGFTVKVTPTGTINYTYRWR